MALVAGDDASSCFISFHDTRRYRIIYFVSIVLFDYIYNQLDFSINIYLVFIVKVDNY